MKLKIYIKFNDGSAEEFEADSQWLSTHPLWVSRERYIHWQEVKELIIKPLS